MATTKKPVVYDDTNNVLTPLADGQVLEPSAIPVSDIDGNVVTVESDGLAVTAESLVSTDKANCLIVQDGKLMVELESGGITIVSADADNLIRAGSDGGAYIDGNDILSNGDVNLLTINATDKKIILTKEAILKKVADDLVDSNDSILKVEDNKIVSEVCITYNPLNGALVLTGVDGKDVCEVTIPGQASVLKSVEFVTTKPDAEGTSTTGTYPVTVQLLDSVAGWIDPVTVNIEATRGTASTVTIEIDAGTTCGGLPSGVVNARAWFVGQESAIYASTGTMGFVFADGSVLNITSYSLNAEGTGYTLTGTFTPTVGVATGAWIHFIFELTDYSICELYVDVSYLIDIYTAGNGIDITNNVVSAKGGDGIVVGAGGIAIDEDWLKSLIETYAPEYTGGTGIVITNNTVAIDEDWLAAKVGGFYYDAPLYFDTNGGTYEWGEVHMFVPSNATTVQLAHLEADGSGTSGLTITMDYDIGTSSPMTISTTASNCSAYAGRAVVFSVSGTVDQTEIAALLRFNY